MRVAASFCLALGLLGQDRFRDGTPDFLRLDSPQDRRVFQSWFTFLAEAQYLRKLPSREISDCAALVRFAYREALREHNGAWAAALELDAVPGEGSVEKYTYPHTPLGANLFRVSPGVFAQFADAQTLHRANTHFITRDIRRAQPGDLLFYRQLEQDLPFHVMIYLGHSHFDAPGDAYIVYHTGPLGGSPGEVRRPSTAELLRHPSPRWRPVAGNGNFLGVYRWNILRMSE
jgi:hypothetical protein